MTPYPDEVLMMSARMNCTCGGRVRKEEIQAAVWVGEKKFKRLGCGWCRHRHSGAVVSLGGLGRKD